MRPDTIVTSQFVVDEIGSDRLGALAEVVVIPDGLAADEQLAELGAALGLEDEAGALIDELDAAVAEAASAVPDDCEVAVVTVYPGPSPAAWVDGSSPVPAVVESLGCTLVPADAGDPDGNGRPFLSLEQIGLLNAPTIIALQSSSVAGRTRPSPRSSSRPSGSSCQRSRPAPSLASIAWASRERPVSSDCSRSSRPPWAEPIARAASGQDGA